MLLPKRMKEAGVPHTPSWDGESPLPEQAAVRLKAGQALIRIGTNIHTGHTVPERERNTLVLSWSKWDGPPKDEPKTCDARTAWQLDPATRSYAVRADENDMDRWAATTKLGDI